MKNLVEVREKATQLAIEAFDLKEAKKYEKALSKYIQAILYFKHTTKCTLVFCINR